MCLDKASAKEHSFVLLNKVLLLVLIVFISACQVKINLPETSPNTFKMPKKRIDMQNKYTLSLHVLTGFKQLSKKHFFGMPD